MLPSHQRVEGARRLAANHNGLRTEDTGLNPVSLAAIGASNSRVSRTAALMKIGEESPGSIGQSAR
jgi:hypothetical protein